VPVGIGSTFDFGNEEDDEQPDAIIEPQMTAAITAGIRRLDIRLTLALSGGNIRGRLLRQ
jgi:hypothetical protein